jgi:hypothetical protein
MRFSSDSRLLDDVYIEFWDRPKPHLSDNWGAKINGFELREFLLKLAQLVNT